MITPTLIPGIRFEHYDREAFSAPGKRQNAADLWQVALFAHERFCALIITVRDLARRRTMGLHERRDYLNWIEPMEKLVRCLLIVRAITWLVMTVEGRKLLRETPKSMPLPPAPPRKKPPAANYIESIPYPGWYTIAANRPTPAQIARRLERMAAEAAAAAAAEALRALRSGGGDPSGWSCPFRVLGYDAGEELNKEWTPPPRKRLSLILDLNREDPAPARAQPLKPREPRTFSAAAHNLARRLEALGRVLANPEPHVMRLARFIARLPHGALIREAPRVATRPWSQLHDEYNDAVTLMLCAMGAYYRVLECG